MGQVRGKSRPAMTARPRRHAPHRDMATRHRLGKHAQCCATLMPVAMRRRTVARLLACLGLAGAGDTIAELERRGGDPSAVFVTWQSASTARLTRRNASQVLRNSQGHGFGLADWLEDA